MSNNDLLEFYLRCAKPIGSKFYSCCGCGKNLKPEDKAVDCTDCAGIFCEDCILDGTFDDHECEEDGDEEE